MTYEEKKKVVEAAKVLKEFCEEETICEECIFWDKRDLFCGIFSRPADFALPKITRWTPEDVALAKALKAFGAIFLEKEKSGAITVCFNNGDLCEAPILAFKCMPDGSYHIDNIIKEAEG